MSALLRNVDNMHFVTIFSHVFPARHHTINNPDSCGKASLSHPSFIATFFLLAFSCASSAGVFRFLCTFGFVSSPLEAAAAASSNCFRFFSFLCFLKKTHKSTQQTDDSGKSKKKSSLLFSLKYRTMLVDMRKNKYDLSNVQQAI